MIQYLVHLVLSKDENADEGGSVGLWLREGGKRLLASGLGLTVDAQRVQTKAPISYYTKYHKRRRDGFNINNQLKDISKSVVRLSLCVNRG